MAIIKEVPTLYGFALTYHRIQTVTLERDPGGNPGAAKFKIVVQRYTDLNVRELEKQDGKRRHYDAVEIVITADHLASSLVTSDMVGKPLADLVMETLYGLVQNDRSYSDGQEVT